MFTNTTWQISSGHWAIGAFLELRHSISKQTVKRLLIEGLFTSVRVAYPKLFFIHTETDANGLLSNWVFRASPALPFNKNLVSWITGYAGLCDHAVSLLGIGVVPNHANAGVHERTRNWISHATYAGWNLSGWILNDESINAGETNAQRVACAHTGVLQNGNLASFARLAFAILVN